MDGVRFNFELNRSPQVYLCGSKDCSSLLSEEVIEPDPVGE